jgi:hypothetical protein
MEHADLDIREEWQLGTGSVHTMDHRLWNADNVDAILKRDSVHRCQWLAAARGGPRHNRLFRNAIEEGLAFISMLKIGFSSSIVFLIQNAVQLSSNNSFGHQIIKGTHIVL